MKKTVIFLFSLIIFVFLLEILLKINKDNYVSKKILYKYSDREKDKSLNLKLKIHGYDCIKPGFIKKMQWNPRYGWSDKKININCIDNLFQDNTVNVAFFGGFNS